LGPDLAPEKLRAEGLMNLLAALISIALLVYLFAALLFPEKF
jgi:K+-transporting ATPase KdpF subunit